MKEGRPLLAQGAKHWYILCSPMGYTGLISDTALPMARNAAVFLDVLMME